MKKGSSTFLLLLLLTFIFYWTVGSEEKPAQSKTAASVAGARLVQNNQIGVWIKNNGTFAREPVTYNAGFYYPSNSDKILFYLAGLWFAGKVNAEIRTACSDYNWEYQPGIILPDGTADDPQKEIYRIYLIKSGDSADSTQPNYNQDYAEWPVALGAPVAADGSPLLLGEQTFWFVMNDADTANHQFTYHTAPLKLEVQVLGWLFNDTDIRLARTLFLHYTFINKNSENIEDAFVGVMCDPDLGDCNDDRSGCDTTLNLSYVYNGRDYDWQYGYDVPAAGFCLLQGPVVPANGGTAFQFLKPRLENFKSLDMNANFVFISGHQLYSDPPYNEDGGQEVYYRMNGLARQGQPLVDPTTGGYSTFFNYGDPISRTGWLDDLIMPPSDRRSLFSSGPFSLASGDTQRVVFAVIIGHEDHRLKSLIALKQNANYIRDVFRSEFQVSAQAEVSVQFVSAENVEVKIAAEIVAENQITEVAAELFNYRNEPVQILKLFDDGEHDDTGAGDFIFGNKVVIESSEEPLFLNIKITDGQAIQHLFQKAVEKITLTPNPLRISDIKIQADHLNMNSKVNPGENIRLTFNINNAFDFDVGNINLFLSTDDPLFSSRPQNYEFYDLKALGSDSLNYMSDKASTYFEMNVSPDMPDTQQIAINATIYDSKNRSWKVQNLCSLKVEPFDFAPEEILAEHIAGNSAAEFSLRIFDPLLLKKHQYIIAVKESINVNQEKGFDLVDEFTNETLLYNHEVPDQYAYNVPVTDGFKIVHAYLPRGGFWARFHELAGGHGCAFVGVGPDSMLRRSLIMTMVSRWESFPYYIELEFCNAIDSAGVIGFPGGQKLFRIENRIDFLTTGFFSAPFKIWKIENGQRTGLLNGAFWENEQMWTLNEVWNPGEVLWVLKSEYDPTGQLYEGQAIDTSAILFQVYLAFRNQQSFVDAGDRINFSYEYPATHEDVFTFVPTKVEKSPELQSQAYELFQNYPNPFNSSTVIKFSLAEPAVVSLKIFNIRGQKVVDLVNKRFEKGIFSVRWDGKNEAKQLVASGLYFARIQFLNQSNYIKLVFIK